MAFRYYLPGVRAFRWWRLQDGRFLRTLELAANHEPVRYHDLVMTGHPKAVPPNPPRKRGYPPAWSDLCRTALGDKSLTPVKWIPQTEVTQEQVQQAVNRLNHRPRKVLGFRAPFEVFFDKTCATPSRR